MGVATKYKHFLVGLKYIHTLMGYFIYVYTPSWNILFLYTLFNESFAVFLRTSAYYNYSKFKHFVPSKCVVSVKHPFVEPRKSIEEVFLEVHVRSVFIFQKKRSNSYNTAMSLNSENLKKREYRSFSGGKNESHPAALRLLGR